MVIMKDRMEYVVRAVMDRPIEHIRERVCRALNQDPETVKVVRNNANVKITVDDDDPIVIERNKNE